MPQEIVSKKRPVTGMTKQQQSEQTKKALLEATLDCLTENGYTGTSTTNVVKKAGVSRGALAHHFPSKSKLVAEAAAYLVNKRARYTIEQLKIVEPGENTIEGWTRLQWQAYEKWFPANIEFMVAARTDPDLRQHFSEAIDRYSQKMQSQQSGFSPDFSSSPSPLLTQYVIGCFIRGLCLERIVNDDALVNDIFDEFTRILDVAVTKS